MLMQLMHQHQGVSVILKKILKNMKFCESTCSGRCVSPVNMTRMRVSHQFVMRTFYKADLIC
jgi:hypothetical protein